MPPDRHVYVFIASCTGCARLLGEIGLPLVHVDVAADVAHAVRLLNGSEHGSGVRVPRLLQPIGFYGGWTDWDMYDYAPGLWPSGRRGPAASAWWRVGIAVALTVGVTFADLRGQLRAALSHLRLPEVTSSTACMEARSEAALDFMVEPRYTPNSATRDLRGAKRVDDIYVLDPAERPWRLVWCVDSARLAAIGGGP